jgi:glycosyltransferase involved in cell wall biosynthesis
MKLLVVSHKLCWRNACSPSGYATDGGFPLQMRSLSELFDATALAVPCLPPATGSGQTPLSGHNLLVLPLTTPRGRGLLRKLGLILWLIRNGPSLIRGVWRADAVHTPIPGDIGTIGMVIAFALQKPLFVRHCGNWRLHRTLAGRFWKWFIERFAGGRNVVLATGGAAGPPSQRNPNIRWIFSTSLTKERLAACNRQRSQPCSRARLITAGRQVGGKGTEVLISSLPLILEDFPETTLDVVGDGWALGGLKALAKTLGVCDRVTFHGRVDHSVVIRLLQEADLFCFPTLSEGFPKVVLEALACGLPVVTTPVSVLPLLVGADCGCLIDQVTPPAIARAVRACLSDEARYKAMSQRAANRASQYSLECWRDAIGNLLQAAWAQPLRAPSEPS